VTAVLLIRRTALFAQMRFLEKDNHDVKAEPDQQSVLRDWPRRKAKRLTEDHEQDADVHRVARYTVQPSLHQPPRLFADEKPHRASEEDRRRPARRQEVQEAQDVTNRANDAHEPPGVPESTGWRETLGHPKRDV